MLDLTQSLPDGIVVNGKVYKIKTWFKHWIRFIELSNTGDAGIESFDWIYDGPIPDDRVAGYTAMMEFLKPPHPLPRESGEGNGEKVMDYMIDGGLIYSAFLEQYGLDLVDGMDSCGNKLHWHKFLALVEGLHGTHLNDVMEARSWDPSDRSTYEESRRKSKSAWELPQTITPDEEAAIAKFDNDFE